MLNLHVIMAVTQRIICSRPAEPYQEEALSDKLSQACVPTGAAYGSSQPNGMAHGGGHRQADAVTALRALRAPGCSWCSDHKTLS
jgi:hypothetical protein